jgi:hypothetical protein
MIKCFEVKEPRCRFKLFSSQLFQKLVSLNYYVACYRADAVFGSRDMSSPHARYPSPYLLNSNLIRD